MACRRRGRDGFARSGFLAPLGRAYVPDSNGEGRGATDAGCVAGRDVRPAAHLLSFASPKESRQRKGDPTCRVPFAALRGNLRCSRPGCRCGTRCVLRTTLRQPQRVSLRGACMLRCTRAPRPLRFSARPEGKGNPHGPSLRSALAPSPQPSPASGRGSLRPSAAMARWGSSPLCACRGAQGVGRAWAAQHAHASCSDSLRLFERSAQRVVSSAVPPHDRAPQVAP